MNNTEVRDLYAETTARIIAALEQGAAPWVKERAHNPHVDRGPKVMSDWMERLVDSE